MEENRYKELHALSFRNSEQIMNSHKCGCFNCSMTFRPYAVYSWCDNSDTESATALCPFCGIDSVLGDACGEEITPTLLDEMNERYIGEHFEYNVEMLIDMKRAKDDIDALKSRNLSYDDMVEEFFAKAEDYWNENIGFDILSEMVDTVRGTQPAPVFYDLLFRAANYCEYRSNSRAAIYFLKQAERLLLDSDHTEFDDWDGMYCSLVCRISDHYDCIDLDYEAEKMRSKAIDLLFRMPLERRYTELFRFATAEKQIDNFLDSNQSDKALALCDEVISALTDESCDSELRPLLARFLYVKADVYHENDDLAHAEELYLQSLQTFNNFGQINDHNFLLRMSEANCCRHLGELYVEKHDDARAKRCFRSACDSIERIDSWKNSPQATRLHGNILKQIAEL